MSEGRKEVEAYLNERDWRSRAEGNTTLYFKGRDPREVGEKDFLGYSKRKKPVNTTQFVEATETFFREREFSRGVLDSVINPTKDTIFVVAGVQYLSDFLRGKREGDGKRYFVPQPVIRTRYRDSVGEGSVSSFVNISTAQVPSSPEEHVAQIDTWMDYLSKTGLNLGDFVLRLEDTRGEDFTGFWNNTRGNVLTFSYGGLELGDAGYLEVGGGPFISDIGFGLERVLWAVNKSGSFADLIGPRPVSFGRDYPLLDSLRTATLIASSGMNRSEDDPRRQFQIYMNQIKERENVDMRSLVEHYHAFWGLFINPSKGVEETYLEIRGELNRQRNLDLLDKLGFKRPPKTVTKSLTGDQERFIQELTERSLTKPEEIRRVFA